MDDVVLGHQAQGDDVDQAVVVEGGVEVDVAGQVRHAQGVAVLPDSVDHALGHPAHLAGVRAVRVAEAQRVGGGDDRRAHAVHVADDATDARRRAFVGQDLGGVVVALMGHDDAPVVIDGNDPGVLHRPHDHVGAVGGQELLECGAAALVGAVLRPHGIIAV